MPSMKPLQCKCHCWMFTADSYLEANSSTSDGLAGQYVVSNQTQLTLRGLVFSGLQSLVLQPLVESTSGPNVTADAGSPAINSSGPLIDYQPAAESAPATFNQTAPLVIVNSTVVLENCSFADNTGFDFGGVAILNNSVVSISHSSFTGLTGRVAGAMLVASYTAALIESSTTFHDNAGTCLAGAVLVTSGSLLAADDVTFHR